MTIKRARAADTLREKVVSFQRIIFLHLDPEGDLAWIVAVKNEDKTNRSVVFLSLSCI